MGIEVGSPRGGVIIVPTASAASTASIKGVGAGKTSGGVTRFELSAHVEDNPTTPETGFGQVQVDVVQTGVGTVSVTIDVRFLKVQPTVGVPHAYITGVVTRTNQPASFAIGTPVRVTAFDGGEPSADTPVDGFDLSGLIGDPNTTCQLLVGPIPANVTQGNIVIKISEPGVVEDPLDTESMVFCLDSLNEGAAS